MSQPPIEDIVRQVAEAFRAAFPQSTMPQQQSQQPPQTRGRSDTRPVASRPADSPCQHTVSSALMELMTDPHMCPECTMAGHIKATQDVQRDFADRGGAFASKDMAHHKTLRQRWRKVKIPAMSALTYYEELLLCPRLSADDVRQLKNALDLWEKKKVALTRVPGMEYVPGAEEDEPTDEEHQVARLMMELLKMVLDKEMTDEDKRSLKKSKKSESRHVRTRGGASIIKGCAETQKDASPQSPTPSTDSRSNPTHPLTGVPHNCNDSGSLKSILKRKASSPALSNAEKRLRVTPTVTVSAPHLNTTNPSPFIKLASTSTSQPHNKHAFVAHRRSRRAFKRGTPHHTAGAWASGADEDKAETSGLRRSWADFESDVEREMEEEREEKAMVAELGVVAGAWMGVWWVRRVLGGLDLRLMRERVEGG
ncbi:hypothetical protein SNOG_14282 [Parastagonospora nodorum SN15]|nr:hypothetical protein SNOG_14282 [Parastagonospora nodorum SN15]EAT78519.2 hypothetical protein SNOG_14282 [Parastagonospora nodorum SN15]